MDEKSQIQALDRTQPSLPMKPGRAGTMTHDYKRHGTTTLFAALNVLTGSVIGHCLPRHRHTEFLKFLKTIDREVPKGLNVHLVLDNYATHNHPNVKGWLASIRASSCTSRRPPAAWLNMVEIFFGRLTDKAIRRGIFHSVPDLITRSGPTSPPTTNNPQTVHMDRHHRPDPRESPPRPSHPQCNHQLKLGRTTRCLRAARCLVGGSTANKANKANKASKACKACVRGSRLSCSGWRPLLPFRAAA